MTRLDWEKAAADARYKRIPHDDITRASKPKKISNAQKKLISTMLKERGMEWDSEINSLSRKEASVFVTELKNEPQELAVIAEVLCNEDNPSES